MLVRFGGYELDKDRRELRLRNVPVHVEPQVLDLLIYLVAHRNHVVSKDEMIDSVWGGRIVSDVTLNSRINAARRAVGDNGKTQALIRTVPRRGFRFVGEVNDAMTPGTTIPGGPGEIAQAKLDDRASIAVLPFTNMSGDPADEYFADGIAEDVITDLSKWRWFFVIARNSSFTYKGRVVDVKQVGRELGVRYLVEGSVRRSGSRLRITAQLIDATSGRHLWAQRFDRETADLFALEDEITQHIAAAIEPAILRAESSHARNRRSEDLAAWDFYLQGLWLLNHGDLDARERALSLFHQALARDSHLADAHVGCARVHLGSGIYRQGDERQANLRLAYQSAQRALAFDSENFGAYATFAIVQAHVGEQRNALRSARSAVELNPNFAPGQFSLAIAALYCGDAAQTIQAIDTAMRLSPLDPQRFARLGLRASALFLLGRYLEAVEVAQESRSLRWFCTPLRVLAASYAELGALEQAQAAVEELLARNEGDTTIAEVVAPFVNLTDRDHYAQALRKAGLPD